MTDKRAATSHEPEDEAILESVELPDAVAGFSKQRVDLVRRAVKQWTSELIDLGGRNNLLSYRDLKRGTLDLTNCSPIALANLLQGKTTRVSALFPRPEVADGVLQRARTIFKKANENFDERGVETLSLACGLATWENTKSAWKPHAPVLIRRASLRPIGAAQDDFDLTLLEEMEVSSTLLHVLKVGFDCEIDQEKLLDRIDGAIDESWELDAAYEWLGENASSIPGFEVEPRLVLANFAYTKLPMVKDLESAFDELVAHDLIAAIAGDEEAKAAIGAAEPDPESVPTPDAVPPQNEFLILDADASQNYAINAVLSGANLIIKGPPGTGKSQTIANLIAALAASGKRVLFVAEKRAAIEAVLKRLRNRKLGDLVVDLHGGISSRREFAQAVGKSLQGIRTALPVDNAPELERLQRNRSTLTQYDTALHVVRDPWGVTVFDARNQLMDLDEFSNGTRFRGKALSKLNAKTARRAEDEIEEYLGLGARTLPNSPWAKSKVATAEDVETAYGTVDDVQRGALPTAQQWLASASNETGLPEPLSLNEWSPRLDLMGDVAAILEHVQSSIFERDLDSLCESLAVAARGGFARLTSSMLSGDYRQARARVRELCTDDGKLKDAQLLKLCESARDQLRAWRSFGATSLPSVPANLGQLRDSYELLMDGLEQIETWVGVNDLCDLNPADVATRLQALLDDRATLVNLPELKRLQASLAATGLSEFLSTMSQSSKDWAKCFKFAWLKSIEESVSLTDRILGGFVPDSHRKVVEDFQEGDRAHIAETPGRIKRICAAGAVSARNEYRQQDEIVQHQANLKRRHMPVRELIRAASEVLQALKPCWVMSPLVVSQLLPANIRFDVVIFDEASQITPADAIPSILRGKQLVVAGDRKQLPPTAFFLTESPEDQDEPDQDDLVVPVVAGTQGFESILDALPEGLLLWKLLEWHYRSRDERLVAFSNAHIYDRMLTTFPGSGYAGVLRHEVAPQDRAGETNSPSPEVGLVVDLVIEHIRARPEESLGVIAMGSKHANRIEEALRLRMSESRELERELSSFLDESKEERFFVKNLERVQGDERDAIILSIGYGKSPNGNLPYRFGPLLQEGGERRLNVAVTRAKKRITLVSSFSSGDMDPEKSSAEGVKLLRQYLQYMESDGENLGDRILEKPPLNAFEVDVRDTLAGHGMKLIPQYGCSGYWIDFAVQHPDRPGEFALAIECDGATYHSSQSARDRDRLRQEQLERLGWRFCRIWSTEWFYHKEDAVDEVLEAYQDAISESALTSPPPPDIRSQIGGGSTAAVDQGTQREGPRPAGGHGLPIDQYSSWQLVALVRWIESDGALRTDAELVEEMVHELGYRRRGNRVMAAINAAVRQARKPK